MVVDGMRTHRRRRRPNRLAVLFRVVGELRGEGARCVTGVVVAAWASEALPAVESTCLCLSEDVCAASDAAAAAAAALDRLRC